MDGKQAKPGVEQTSPPTSAAMPATEKSKDSGTKKAGKEVVPEIKAKDVKAGGRSESSQDITRLILLVLLLASSSYASKFVIHPLFGPLLSASYFRVGCFASTLICTLAFKDNANTHRTGLGVMALFLVMGSTVARPLGAWAAEHIEDPTRAPLVVHAVLAFPALSFGSMVWLQWMKKYSEQDEPTYWGDLAITSFSLFALTNVISYAERLIAEALTAYSTVPPSILLLCLGIMTYALPIFTTPASVALSPTVEARYHRAVPCAMIFFVAMRSFLDHSPAGITVHFQQYSTTGLVQVADSLLSNPPFRYLRCDASILGRAWLVSEEDGDGPLVLGDSTQASYVLQDAVRLVRGPRKNQALIIGVGAGVSARSLITHGYNTTLVELDPAVYAAARAHFELPEPAAVYLEDAERWVQKRARVLTAAAPRTPGEAYFDERFDVIVHDVFTGGALPSPLFTLEFWESLRVLLDDDGVIAVNFVGRRESWTFKSALHTLLSTFNTCRAFHDAPVGASAPAPTSPGAIADFVIFCTPADALSFRVTRRTDFLGSPLREAVLSTLPQRELDIGLLLADAPRERLVLRASDSRLASWGKESMVAYWKTVRQSLPAAAWGIF